MTKERPILFSAPMVRAILGGRKTQTRRLLQPRHDYSVEDGEAFFAPYVYGEPEPIRVPCPYGAPGDQLWVRETWATRYGAPDDYGRIYYRADHAAHETDGVRVCPAQSCEVTPSDIKWRPSIHMPRWASRITLEVTSVRIERLQDISDEDAISEGTESIGHFLDLWEGIYGVDSLVANPYVWVIGFRRLP